MAEPTTYIVLRAASVSQGDDTSAGWLDVATIDANSGTAAIRHMAKKSDITGGTYVAVPARSFKPVTVKAETVVTLKIEEAG